VTVALLVVYAGLLATLGRLLLRRAAWTRRAPRLAIAAWLALSTSTIGSVVLAGLTLAEHHGTRPCGDPCPSPTTSAAPILLAVLALAARVLWCLTAAHLAAARERRRQLNALAVLGRDDHRLGATLREHSAPLHGRRLGVTLSEHSTPARGRRRLDALGRGLGVTLVEHSAPAAYCLPGRGGRIVVTTAALAALDDDRLAAVIAHERAHLRQRHHLVLAFAQGLVRVFPPVFRVVRDEIAYLVELAADDAAARRHGRLTTADALVTLAEAAIPAPALTAGGSHAAARAGRLIAGPAPLGRVRVLMGLAAAALIVAAPLTALAGQDRPAQACCSTSAHAAP
jgi:Zn-dependent protease with chaperone function